MLAILLWTISGIHGEGRKLEIRCKRSDNRRGGTLNHQRVDFIEAVDMASMGIRGERAGSEPNDSHSLVRMAS